ncbi:MAG TPA: uracil phosphoribosyltransferase [Acidimicrobiales bacterium]|nr:uracil phosphoribosyltransferase [Acidimicrobiales bacterium]
MDTLVVDHPLAAQLLTRMRDERTDRAVFRQAADELALMLVYEATRALATEPVTIRTPLTETQGVRVTRPPMVVPVLRAGLGMLGPVLRLLPGSDTGFIGVARDETTHEPVPYMNSVPDDLDGRDVLVLDPMLATGGSMVFACEQLAARNPGTVTAVCILAAPEGVDRLGSTGLVDRLVTASVDDHLDEDAFIVPGLGDAGDRLFGTA